MDHIHSQICSYALSTGSKHSVDKTDDPESIEEGGGSSTHGNYMGDTSLQPGN